MDPELVQTMRLLARVRSGSLRPPSMARRSRRHAAALAAASPLIFHRGEADNEHPVANRRRIVVEQIDVDLRHAQISRAQDHRASAMDNPAGIARHKVPRFISTIDLMSATASPTAFWALNPIRSPRHRRPQPRDQTR